MMSNRLFNSILEMELRLLLLLEAEKHKAMSLERLICLDFISCYAENYQLSYINLHGENELMYGEIASRKMLSQDAIRDLVVKGLVEVSVDNGYIYKINKAGRKYINSMQSEYAKQYREIAVEALSLFKKYSDEELYNMIQKDGIDAIRKGARHCIT